MDETSLMLFAAIAIGLVLLVYPVWKIIDKTGMSTWLTLLLLVPGFGAFLIMAILAFAGWPAARRETA